MITIQQSTHLSNSNMRQLASCLNKLTPKGSGVEPYFQAKFARSGEVTKEFFQSSQLCLQKQDQEVERTVVHCKDFEGFIWHVLEARCCSAPETLLKISLDNGGGFFKICLQVINLTEDSKSSETRKLSFQKEVISTSVKKVFILSIVQDISESYSNLSQLLKILEVQKIKALIACDLKVANLLCGIQAHSSKHPCCYCVINSDNLADCGELRTFGSLRQDTFSYKSSNQKKAKLHNNSVNEPILPEEDHTTVLSIIPPPELNLLLGVVNHLFVGLKKVWPIAEQWPQMSHVKSVAYHGGDSFNGPGCHKLLQNIDKLLKTQKSALFVLPWIAAFRDFKKVVH